MRIEESDKIKRLYNTRSNRRLKHCALGAISVSIILMFFMIIRMDTLSVRTIHLLRGCVGAGAIIFFILCGWLTYRVYSEYHNHR